MDTPHHIPIAATPKPAGGYRSDATAAQFWFEPSGQGAPDHITGREKFAGVALAGVLTALATIGYYAIGGAWTDSLPLVVLILFFTAIGIGFFLLRREGPGKIADAELVGAMIAEIDAPALVSDREGHLVCANPAYREYFKNQTPSPRKLLFDPEFGEGVRGLLRSANQGKRALRRFAPKTDGEPARFITAAPQGGYVVWTFGEEREADDPLSALGDLESAFHYLLDRFSAGLVIQDAAGVVRHANPTALKLLEAAPHDVKGVPAAEALSRERLSEQSLDLEWLPLKEPAGGESGFSFGLLTRVGEREGPAAALEEFSSFVEDAPIAIAVLDTDTLDVQHLNTAAETLLRKFLKKPPRPGDNFLGLLPESHKKGLRGRIEEIGKSGPARPPFEFSFREEGSDVIQVFFSGAAVEGRKSAILYLIDTSEVKRLEMQFVQAQKMQAVGQLAGGVAHDFNNLLTAIIGFCDLLLMRHKAGDQSFADLIQIKQNANRAADLIRQLLAFSRRQALHPKVLNVTEVISDLSNLIRRLIGEKVKLRIRHGKGVGFIRADQSQIEQVIVNLAVNARDAMPKGGQLVIATEFVPESAVAKQGHGGLEKKDYIRIRVEDTGAGIPLEYADKV
ncbi:MAG TPA: histidine kinase dimerization/phospho-acceptor domain-containing protein, partial [Sphingomonadales bacterium]|nr:histidine kinase dimerization/phospho-acceptor domain-containing protein [Sphingomonadales bacterium]